MTLNTKLLALLRELARSPRGLIWMEKNLDGSREAQRLAADYLVELGFATPPRKVFLSYVITAKGRDYLASLPPAAEPRSFVQRAPYVPSQWVSVRPGADNHRAIRSKGIGA